MGPPTVPSFRRAAGVRLIDGRGRAYLDACSGTFNLSLGYNHPGVVDAVQRQLGKCSHVSSHFTQQAEAALITKLCQRAPNRIRQGWVRDITGSTANEGAIKVAMKYSQRSGVISFKQSHHGQTLFLSNLSKKPYSRIQPAPQPGQLLVEAPYCYRCPYRLTFPQCGFLCLEKIRDKLKKRRTNYACFLVEPILGQGGNIVPPPGYFRELSALCREFGIVLIADEVQTGIGRTGYMFASELLQLSPDVITLAKGLGGIGIPVGAILYQKRLAVLERHEHSFTSGGNLLALQAANATIDEIGRAGFLERVRHHGQQLGVRLETLKARYRAIGDVRGVGYMWGLEITTRKGMPNRDAANKIVATALAKCDLILRSSYYGFGNVVKIRPALIATAADLDDMVERLERAIKLVCP